MVFALLAAGVVALAVGFALDELVWVYCAVGFSLLGLALMVMDTWRSRRALSAPEPEAEEQAEEQAEDEPVAPTVLTARSDDDVVLVMAGRKRYHQPGCSLVTDGAEEVTVAEAVDEGFTACTRCAPQRLAAS